MGRGRTLHDGGFPVGDWLWRPVTNWASFIVQSPSETHLELLTTCKDFVRSLEYCSPLWAGSPVTHLSQFHAVETKAFRIVGISRDEAETLGLSLSHHRLVVGFSVFYRLLSSLAAPALSVICPHHISTGASPVPYVIEILSSSLFCGSFFVCSSLSPYS